MSCTKQAHGSQRGVVLLSVLSLMLILSVLVSSAGRQMHWLLQATTQGTNQAREQADHRLLVAALFALDVVFLSADTDNELCRWIAQDVCVRFYPQFSAEFIWRFRLMQQQADGSQKELAGGWLRKRGESPHAVAALWFSSPPL